MGLRGLTGPPGKNELLPFDYSIIIGLLLGRDGFVERPPSFYAELRRLFTTKNADSVLRPWTVSETTNAPDVSTYFSPETGIFTAPIDGLYQFYVTISVSKAKVNLYSIDYLIISFVFPKGISLYFSKRKTCVYRLG